MAARQNNNGFGSSLINPDVAVLDKDTHPSHIRSFNYTDGLNISAVAQGQNTQRAIMPIIGDALAFTIPSISAQSKEYQVVIDTTIGTNTEIVSIYDSNGNQIGSAANITIVHQNPSSTITNFETAFSAQTSGYSVSYSSSISGYVATIIVTLDIGTNYGFEWTLIRTGGTASIPELVVTEYAEAIDTSITGLQYPLSSYEDEYNNLWLWSTTVNVLPTSLSVTGAVSGTSSHIKLAVASTANIAEHSSIVVSGVGGVSNATGTWICHVVDSTHVELLNSSFSGSYTSGGTITLNNEGYGQVGVAVKNTNNNTWTYTRLLGSKEWNWRTQYQIRGASCIENGIWCHYWTNNNEVPRNMYYKGVFFTNGGIETTTPPTGVTNYSTYTYGNINTETTLLQTFDDMVLSYTGTTTGGGQLLSGNWRYFIVGVTKELNTGNPTYLTNPIPVYSAQNNVSGALADQIFGNDAGTPTTKINNFVLSNIQIGVYYYVDLYGVNYTGNGSSQTYRISRTALPENNTTLVLQHTGNETDTDTVPNSQASVFNTSYATVGAIELFNNRLLFANITQNGETDYSSHAASVTWAVGRVTIPSIGNEWGYAASNAASNPAGAEFEDPKNCYNYTGYMINETYRFGLMYHEINKGWTRVFFSKDLLIDPTAYSLDANLTTNATDGTESVYSYCVIPTMPSTTSINGIPLNQLVDMIQVVRVDMTTGNFTEILCTGIGIKGVNNLDERSVALQYQYGGATSPIGEYTWVSGLLTALNTSQPNVATYPTSVIANKFNPQDNYLFCYFPDNIWGNIAINWISNDILINYGTPLGAFDTGINNGAAQWNCNLAQYNGYLGASNTPQSVTLPTNAVITVTSGGSGTLNTSIPISKNLIPTQDGGTGNLLNPTSPVIYLGTSASNSSGQTDYGLCYIQYKRPISGTPTKFGNPINSIYITTGATFYITPQTIGNLTGNVFGGDTFTQKTYFKHRYQTVGTGQATSGNAAGIAFYSQNRINSQLRTPAITNGVPDNYPAIPSANWLLTLNAPSDFIGYNGGYTPQNIVQTSVAFDSNNPVISQLPTRIPYSLTRANDSQIDNYRFFPPLQFRDLDASDGGITNLFIQNTDCYAIQGGRLSRLYFNTSGRLNVTDAAEIVEGDAGVMSTPPKKISILGQDKRWSYGIGISEEGNNTYHWINYKTNKHMRFANDGVKCLSDIFNMSQFFKDNLNLVRNYDTPAAGQGLTMGWDEARGEMLITARAWNNTISAWTAGTYSQGANVTYGSVSFYSDIPQIWTSLVNGNTDTPSLSSSKWLAQPFFNVTNGIYSCNNYYYNCWTLAFSEKKHGYTTFYSPLPKIYIPFDNTYLLCDPRPADTGNIYEQWRSDSGTYNSWFGGSLVGNGYISFAVNHSPSILKRFLAVMINCKVQPYKVSVTTDNQYTFMLSTDGWVQQFQKWMIAVYQDINTGNGLTTGTGQDSFGNYAIVTFYFQQGQFQLLQDFFMRTSPSAPLP